ncbi:hypothetical protein ACL02S_18405 [Nocardia sp. 004]|uniref:hypothetical protein n=1 Tax=Nocardia sp. 004 TaxID=3385978 RepID=UPI0039A0906D
MNRIALEDSKLLGSRAGRGIRFVVVMLTFVIMSVGNATTAAASQVPDRISTALDQLRQDSNILRHSPGTPPYRPCGMSDERKHIRTYDVQGGRRAFMVCGNREYGFEHIKGRHMDDWSNKALITGDRWMNLMDYSIEAALRHPEATSKQDGKTCFARKIWMYDKRNGEITGKYFWNNVIVKDSNGDIITAYPTSAAHRCVG